MELPNIDNETVVRYLEDNCERLQLSKYQQLIEDASKLDEQSLSKFIKGFTLFFALSWRRIAIGKERYNKAFINSWRSKDRTFRSIMTEFQNNPSALIPPNKPKSCEPSCSSKILAILDPNKPIWDTNIRKALALPEISCNTQVSMDLYDLLYSNLTASYATNAPEEWITAFNQVLPQYASISRTKKIDCILWCYGLEMGKRRK